MSTADTDTVDILERIRDLEEQIAGQQVIQGYVEMLIVMMMVCQETIRAQQLQISGLGSGLAKDGGYESQSASGGSAASSTSAGHLANLCLNINIAGEDGN